MDRSSDAYPEPDLTRDGALAPGSTANGDPESHDAESRPDAAASADHNDALVEGNRVATADDME